MNRYNYFVFTAFLLSFVTSYSMEPLLEAEAEKPHIIIANDTTYKIKIEYAIEGAKPLGITGLPRHGQSIFKDPRFISLLKVSPSGEITQHIKFKEPLNIANDIKETAMKYPNQHVQVTILPSKELTEWVSKWPIIGWILKPVTQKAEEYFYPFEFTYTPIPLKTKQKGQREESIVPKDRLIISAFPQVKFAHHEKGHEISARHFLEVPQGASKDSIDEKYFYIKKQWEKEKENYPSNTEYVDKVLELLKTAYTALRSPEELKDLINKEIVTQRRYS